MVELIEKVVQKIEEAHKANILLFKSLQEVESQRQYLVNQYTLIANKMRENDGLITGLEILKHDLEKQDGK